MLAELFDRICSQAATAAGQAKKLEMIDIPGDPRRKLVTFGSDKELLALPAPVRKHTVESLEDLVRLVKTCGSQVQAVIWHSADAVVAILDDADRHDRITMDLHESEQMLALSSNMLFDQARLIRFLRVTLSGTGAERFVPVFRRLDFHRSNSAASSVKHGDESLGRSIEAKVQGTEEIPEELTLAVPVYANMGLRKAEPIRLAVEIDVSNERFALTPLADQMQMARQNAQLFVREKLNALVEQEDLAERVSVVCGRP